MLLAKEVVNLYAAYYYLIYTSETGEERQDTINDISHEEVNKIDKETKLLIKESYEKQIPIFTFDSVIRKKVLLEFALKTGLDIPRPFSAKDSESELTNYKIKSCLVDRIDVLMTDNEKELGLIDDYDIFLNIPKIDKRIQVVGGTYYGNYFFKYKKIK